MKNKPVFKGKIFKAGDLVTFRLRDVAGIGKVSPGLIGVVVEFRKHNSAHNHPWWGDTVIALWEDGTLDENSTRVLQHANKLVTQ